MPFVAPCDLGEIGAKYRCPNGGPLSEPVDIYPLSSRTTFRTRTTNPACTTQAPADAEPSSAPPPDRLERVVDDFVFVCFLVGNDFLPRLPAMDIGEGGLALLFRVYTEEFAEHGRYLTKHGVVDWHAADRLFRRLGLPLLFPETPPLPPSRPSSSLLPIPCFLPPSLGWGQSQSLQMKHRKPPFR